MRVGDHLGVPPKSVAAAAQVFISKLHTAIAELDARYHAPDDLDADGFEAVIEVAGWAHSEWVRIHPFANGNGRTARILTNAILMRYGLPPALRLRPRPHGPYAAAGLASMKREWADMVAFLRSTVLAAIADAQP